jgi:hypothetical protein
VGAAGSERQEAGGVPPARQMALCSICSRYGMDSPERSLGPLEGSG